MVLESDPGDIGGIIAVLVCTFQNMLLRKAKRSQLKPF